MRAGRPAAAPTGTAITRPTSTPTTAFAPAVSPPAPFTVRAVGRDSSGSARRVQTRSGERRSPLARPAPSQRPHDPHNIGPLPHGPRDLGDTVGLCCAHTHHTAPAPWAACSCRARHKAALASPSAHQPRGMAPVHGIGCPGWTCLRPVLPDCSASDPLAGALPQSSWLVEGPGSARRMVVEPGLQVAGLCEIEQVFRQLLQLVQGQR